MTKSYPYTLFSCPCTKDTTSSTPFDRIAKPSEDDEDEEQPFNPHSPRANLALLPLDHLLFCNECHEIRCPRCYYEEALYYYCPSCLFEVSSGIVKTETNRCTRSCFQCPICIAPLAIQSLANTSEERIQSTEPTTGRDGLCMLACLYCSWTSLDVRLRFDRPVNISGQLSKILNAHLQTKDSVPESLHTPDPYTNKPAPADQFLQLACFYKNQIAETAPAGSLGLGFGQSYGLDSPSQLSRLLSTYGVGALKKQRGPMPIMREALSKSEGVRYDDYSTDDAILANIRQAGWHETSSIEQQQNQALQQRAGNRPCRFTSDLLPLATQLRTKRAKRCRTCRHNLVKPDEKRQKNKFSIRLVALNYLPHTSLKPLNPNLDLNALRQFQTVQFLLTLRNPMFDAVKVTLATPQETPGSVKSKVTILCPQFSVGANADVWDEALGSTGGVEEERRKAREGLEGPMAEAGKIWKKGRNWTTVVMEMVPGSLTPSKARPSAFPKDDGGEPQEYEQSEEEVDKDLLEIPIFVRLEYETDESTTGALVEEPLVKLSKDKKIKREIAYWCVVGAGRIAQRHTSS